MYLMHVIEEVFQGNDIEVTFQPYYLLQNYSLLSTLQTLYQCNTSTARVKKEKRVCSGGEYRAAAEVTVARAADAAMLPAVCWTVLLLRTP